MTETGRFSPWEKAGGVEAARKSREAVRAATHDPVCVFSNSKALTPREWAAAQAARLP